MSKQRNHGHRPEGDRPGRRPPGRRGEGDRLEGSPAPTSWDHVAGWYDKLVGDEGSDYHRHVLLPAAVRMLDVQPGERVLDLCCGQGVFTRLLAERGAGFVLGADASSRLIAAARARGPHSPAVRYVVADARRLGDLADGSFDAAALLMAVQDLDPVEEVFVELARALRVGGRAVVIMMHPCFRIPRQSSWGWDDRKRTQYRRLDRYTSLLAIPIATHPGRDPGQHTTFFHRPLGHYLNALGLARLGVVACEELLTHRRTEPGGRSRGENRAREEFPIFLALKALRLPGGQPSVARD